MAYVLLTGTPSEKRPSGPDSFSREIKEELAVKVKSKALEINLADYHVDVAIDAKYSTLQEVLSKYYGLMEGLNTLLKELSHPYKNWRFIVSETRKYSLEYFHLIKNHPKGPDAASLLSDVFFNAIESDIEREVKIDAVDNLMLLLQKIVKAASFMLLIFYRLNREML